MKNLVEIERESWWGLWLQVCRGAVRCSMSRRRRWFSCPTKGKRERERDYHRLWTWANQQNSNYAGYHLLSLPLPPARLTAWPPWLAGTVENCVHVMHSHPFITSRCWVARQQRLAFWIPANMPCSHVIPNVPSAQNAPAAHYPAEREREREEDREWDPAMLYFILPNEQTSCRTREQMGLLVVFCVLQTFNLGQTFAILKVQLESARDPI